jgi:hypothetical protein
MDVDPPPRSTVSPMVEEEKKPDEPMAQEVTAPPLVPKGSEQKAVVPPSEQIEEKASVQDSLKAAEGVPVSKIDGSSCPSKPSVLAKARNLCAPLKPINEDLSDADDVQAQLMADEELRNPLETFPLFPVEDGPNGLAFNEQLHNSKLAFFWTSPYEGEPTSLSPRFWTKEQTVYYARILFCKNCIFKHKILDFAELERLPCFHQTIEQIEQVFLKGFLHFNHGWNHEVILQFYATLYISGDIADSST